MFCKNCGKEITERGKFCPYCGVEKNMAGRKPIQKKKSFRINGTTIIVVLLLVIAGGCAFVFLKGHNFDCADKSIKEQTISDNILNKVKENDRNMEMENTSSTEKPIEKVQNEVITSKAEEENIVSSDIGATDKQMALDNLGLLNRQAGAIYSFGWNSFDSQGLYDNDLGFWISLILEYYTDCKLNHALPIDVKEVEYVDYDPKSYSRFGCFRAERKEIDWVLNNIFHMASPVNLNIYEDDGEEIAFAYAMNEYYYIHTDGLGIVASSTVDTSIIGKGEQGDYLIKMLIDGETFILDASLEKYNGKNYWSFYSIEHQ